MLWRIKRRSTHSYGLQLGGQCVSQTYNLLLVQELASGQNSLEPQETPQESAFGEGFPIAPFNFTKAGTVELTVKANMPSDAPVKPTILNALRRKIRTAQPSTQAGPYTVGLEAPGVYTLGIGDPRFNAAKTHPLGTLDVTMCGEPAIEFWLKQYVKLRSMPSVDIPVAPMGIAAYGVKEDGGHYSTYILTTDAVKGEIDIPPDISVTSHEFGGSPSGREFSVQLNAFIVAELKDGTTQYYWTQNVISFDENKGLKAVASIWEEKPAHTTYINIIRGNCRASSPYICDMPGSIPFGRVELEMRAYAADGKIIVEFYAKGEEHDNATMYDKVTITPHVPATSAHIVIASATTPRGHPLDLELVFAGHDGNIPYAVLNAGRIGLELYVRMNGAWVPPPSAWSIGSATHEASHARVEPQGVGSALVVPGVPNPRKLW